MTLRVGILADPAVWKWEFEAIRNVAEVDGVEITTVITDQSIVAGSSNKLAGSSAMENKGVVSLSDLNFSFKRLERTA
jgi:hypothetical protein